jgi:hypothetical protein
MGLDVTKVADAFNKIAGAKRAKVYSLLMAQFKVESALLGHLRVQSGVQKNQIYYGSNAMMTEVLQGWVRDKVKKGDLELVPAETTQRRHMIFTGIKPDDIVGTIEGQMFDETRAITDQDLVKLMLEMIVEQAQEDRIFKQLYKGKYIEPTNNSTNAAENAVNGFGEVIEAGLEESDEDKRINGINISGALADDTSVYEQLAVDFKLGIHPKYRYRPMHMYIAPEAWENYKAGREEAIGTHVNTEDKSSMLIPGTAIRIFPEMSMIGSGRVFVTPQFNLVRVVDKKTDQAGALKAKDYAVDEVTIYGDYHEAFGFEFNKLVWTNNLSNSGSGGGDENENFVD